MNAHVPMMQRSLSELVEEFNAKAEAIPAAIEAFEKAGSDMKMAATIEGTYGQGRLDVGRVFESDVSKNLLTSAWRHVYDGLNIKVLASPNDKRLFDQMLSNPPPFTLTSIKEQFGRFILDPRGSVLRGLAEVFCGLDQAYKSHDKVKVGVAGLPKRIVLGGFANFSSYGRDKVETIVNALASYQGKPLLTYEELRAIVDDTILLDKATGKPRDIGAERGIKLKRFQNGNGHLHFEPATLLDINRALSEFYGDVLPDTTDEKPAKPAAGTAVSKDLQYYPTPQVVIDRVIGNGPILKGELWLEPSCGDGRMLASLARGGARVQGVEVDFARAAQARRMGYPVQTANFLDCVPEPIYDGVLMNPPFYGKHYAKHVRHAVKFLKPGGVLKAILPVTARYDHGLLDDLAKRPRWSDGAWDDLPVGSFSESGTNINTTVLTFRAPDGQ
jgi:hypothetical protein